MNGALCVYQSIEMTGVDQFYTKPEVAEQCLKVLNSLIDVDSHDVHLEPSAGKGAFFLRLDPRKRFGVDIDPQCSGVVQMDFLRYCPELGRKYLVVGNPPFGRVSSIAIRFFNKCAEFADCIAFILPRTFKRVSVQNKLNEHFELLHTEDLPLKPCCFEPKMSAKCCFQVWIRSEQARIRVSLPQRHPHFSFVAYGPKDAMGQPTPPSTADFALKAYGSNCGQIVDTALHTLRPKSWHWIQANNTVIDIYTLKKRLMSLDYSISKDTVRQESIGMRELIQLYADKYGY